MAYAENFFLGKVAPPPEKLITFFKDDLFFY